MADTHSSQSNRHDLVNRISHLEIRTNMASAVLAAILAGIDGNEAPLCEKSIVDGIAAARELLET